MSDKDFNRKINALARGLILSKRLKYFFRAEGFLYVVLLLGLISSTAFVGNLLSLCFIWLFILINVYLLGVRIMHSYLHNALGGKSNFDKRFGAFALNVVAGDLGFNWDIQHNKKHHTDTNIAHHDDDLSSAGLMRLADQFPKKRMHGLQKYTLYVISVYSLTVLYWISAKSFVNLLKYKKEKPKSFSLGQKLLTLVFVKLIYIAIWIVWPIYLGANPYVHVAAFICMYACLGIILTFTFQLAHRVESTPTKGVEEKRGSWAVHQLKTTANFCKSSAFITWFTGALNHQVEHHLFPKVHPRFYPSLSLKVEALCKEYGVSYYSYEDLASALSSHLNELKRLSK